MTIAPAPSFAHGPRRRPFSAGAVRRLELAAAPLLAVPVALLATIIVVVSIELLNLEPGQSGGWASFDLVVSSWLLGLLVALALLAWRFRRVGGVALLLCSLLVAVPGFAGSMEGGEWQVRVAAMVAVLAVPAAAVLLILSSHRVGPSTPPGAADE